MAFRVIIFCILSVMCKLLYASANTYVKLESYNIESMGADLNSRVIESSGVVNYNPSLDPLYNCDGWSWWCDIKFGLKNAESHGINGLMINGYAYHPIAGAHWPTGYDSNAQLNELTIGAGYTRTFYNRQYNTEYVLYGMAFMDSFYKPEVHVGYAYQKYFDMNDSGSLKWGIGYTPFIFVKSSMIGDAPIPLPAVGLMTSFKVDKFNLMLTYFNVIFMNARVDF